MTGITTSIGGPLREARFVDRPNRFVVRCRLAAGDELVAAHIRDRGRLEAILVPGRRLWVRESRDPARRTAWTALLAERPDRQGLVSLDTTLPNRLIRQTLEAGALPELDGWRLEQAEWRHGGSRFDFLLSGANGRRLVLEVKSVGWVEDGIALFPDAVTARGARHLRELAGLAGREGWRAAVLFVVQRDDALAVRAASRIDPDFAAALEDARARGVLVLARRCQLTPDGITLGEPLPYRPPS